MLLKALCESGGLYTAELAQLLGMSMEMTRRRSRGLHALDLVAVTALAAEMPNLYRSTPKGAAHVARVFALDGEGLSAGSRGQPVVSLHRDLTVAIYVALTVACAKSKTWQMVEFEFEAATRRRVGSVEGMLIPDAIAVLEHRDGGRVALAIESDGDGAENPSRLATRKMIPLGDARERGAKLKGVSPFVVVWLSPDLRRRNRIASAAWSAGCPLGVHYFLSLPELDSATILRDAWWTFRPSAGGGARLVHESPVEIVQAPVATTVVTARCDGGNGQRVQDADGSVIMGVEGGGCFTLRRRT